MNPLKEYPHLFANGKFAAWYEPPEDSRYESSKFTIRGRDADAIRRYLSEGWPDWVKHCTLIARPIEDMTDEEIAYDLSDERYDLGEKDFSSGVINAYRESIKDDWTSMNGETLLYLLSIGVYPFDQKAFQNGTVININEI